MNPKWNAEQRRGYLIAREWMVLQFFLWGAALIGLLTYQNSDYRSGPLEQGLTAGVFAFVVTYFPVLYIRMCVAAWRIWRRYDDPPEVTAEEDRQNTEAVLKALTRGVE